MMEIIDTGIDMGQIDSISIGTFRMAKDYLKKMRKQYPDALSVQYPYTLKDGVYGYTDEKQNEIENTMVHMVSQYVERKKIFLLKEDQDV